MTDQQLAQVLTNTINLLKQNQQNVTPEILQRAQDLYQKVKQAKDIIQPALVLTDDQIDKLFSLGDKLLEFEGRLVMTDLTDHYVTALNGLLTHPLILRLAAALFV